MMMTGPEQEPAGQNASAAKGPGTKGYIRTHRPELFIIAPVALSLFWNNVAANERMWLPSEAITIPAASTLHSVPRGGHGLPRQGR
jgi:hypothetical protein